MYTRTLRFAGATILFLSALALSAPSAFAQRKTLDVYVIDVEGGNATLFVSPTGESLLMDTGNVAPGDVRDAGRIMAAIHDAGLTQIDHLIITHWHGDHFGGLSALAPQIPIREFIDHGKNMQPAPAADEFQQKTYPQIIAELLEPYGPRHRRPNPRLRTPHHATPHQTIWVRLL